MTYRSTPYNMPAGEGGWDNESLCLYPCRQEPAEARRDERKGQGKCGNCMTNHYVLIHAIRPFQGATALPYRAENNSKKLCFCDGHFHYLRISALQKALLPEAHRYDCFVLYTGRHTRSASSGLLVVTAPASPNAPRFLPG